MAKVLMVLAPERFQEIEYQVPKAILEDAGEEVETASTIWEPMSHLGNTVKADLLLENANPEDFDVVVFVGGPGTPYYFEHPVALELARQFYETGKITAAICAGPGILAHAGLLKGKQVTAWPGVGEALHEFGAIYTAAPVQRDGLLLTANGPQSADAFGRALVEMIEV